MEKNIQQFREQAQKPSVYPLTSYERGMYIEQKMHPASTVYNLNVSVTFRGAAPDQVKAAMKTVLAAHEAFHSTYGDRDGKPVRILCEEPPTIREAKAASRDEVMEIVENYAEPFDLETGIPLRPTVYAVDDGSVILHMAIHHIAFDGGSAKTFLNELAGALGGQAMEASAPDLSDFWNREEQEAKERGLSYFREVLSDGVPVCEMPVRGKRPALHPQSDRVLSREYDAAALEKINSAAKQLGITNFEMFFGAASIALAKYTGTEDVVMGIPATMRPAGAEAVIGMFVNTAPVRVRPLRGMASSDYLRQAREAVRAATHGARVPFEEIVAEFVKERDPSRSPVFDVSLNYLYDPPAVDRDGVTAEMYVPLQRMGRDFAISIRRTKTRLRLYLQYASELFEDEVAENFLEQITYTLDNLCENSGQTVGEAAALPPAQMERLERFSVTAEAEPTETLLHRLFEKNAAAYPDRTALIAADCALTYRELNEKANAVANNLIDLGIRPGDSVALLLPRRSCFFTCLLGALKAGAAFIPCDPQYPADRINHIIQDSGASFIITTADKLAEYPGGKGLDVNRVMAETNTGDLGVEITGDALAYMIYTSGSTGKPKGVMLRHAGISNFCATHPANILYETVKTQVERMLAVTTVSFDLSLKDTLGILCNGKTVVFASEAQMNDPRELAALIRDQEVDAMNATPSRYLQYLEYPPFREALRRCRLVMAGGEPFPAKLLDTLRELGIPDIINTYGPTETTISSNMAHLAKADHISVGRPLLNVREYIVDADLNLVPRGVRGELLIGGAGVAKGYRNLPQQTAARFIEYNGQRVYRSGDFAKWDADGNVMILGRMDGQIKLRGLRIELGEIESVIERFGGMKEVAVAVKTIGGAEHLAAYFTADTEIDISALKAYAASKLTHYMVPTAYMQLKEMPHTLNGKKDLRNLPEPVLAEKKVNTAPRELTKFDRELCALAEKAIGAPVTETDISLLNLGMTSLSAISFAIFVEEKYGCELPVSALMRGMSISQAEDIIYDSLLRGGVSRKEAAAETVREEYPLSSNQLGVYYEVMKKPQEVLYNMPLCYCFDSVDAERLKAAVEKAVACHAYMNTHIGMRQGSLVQVRNDGAKAEVPIREMTEEEFEQRRNTFVQPFDLHKDRLYRFEIVKAEGKTYLLSDIHHIIFDGLSRGVFMDTVSKAYIGEPVEPEALSYFDYALSENRDRESGAFRQSEKYFSDLMSNFESVSEIPSDQSGKPEDGRIGTAEALLARAPVEAFCRQKAVTPASLFLAAAFYTVSRFVNSKNVYISTISGGRSSSGIRLTVGMFVHTLPLHMNFDEKMTADELIGKSNAALLESIEHENYPFVQFADKYGYSTEIMYECQLGVGGGKNSVGDAAYKPEYLKLEAPKFKVTIAIEDRDGQIAVSIRYNDAVYTAAYMQTLAESVKMAAEGLMNRGDADTASLSLVTEEEKRRLLAMGQTAEEEVPIKLLHRVFEQQAAEHPQKTALIACDRTETYEELNSNANRVANALIARKVCRGDSVVLLLPRRSFYFEAMFGALKAGAAFIPCDPEYPSERIKHIIGDSRARFILTTQEHMAEYPSEQALLMDELRAEENTETPDVALTGDDLAYMIYTSGSTGKPKGVMLRHEGICNYLLPHPANAHIHFLKNNTSVYLSVTTVSFDMSFKEHTAALCNGKTLVFASEDEANAPRALAQLMERHHVDCFNATPSRLQQYLEYAPFRAALAGCKLVMSGGEGYPLSLRDQIKACSGDIRIFNTYGPTEITVSCNAADITEAGYITVGRPLLNYRDYIVDADMNLLPRGVMGELLIGGVGVAKGYRNLPEQTAARFVEYNGQRVYRSGDFARWDADGNVMILGRMDGQVKLRGLRIELGEIESVISRQPHIKKAVAAIKKLGGADTLCAYYTADCEIKPEVLKAELAKSLTHYMVPTAYLQLDTIPVTPNGKTDMKALPDPAPVSAGAYSAPRNDTEKYFCELFQQVLHLEKVGATDNFFEIGGTSLLVTSVVIDAADHGFEITYGDIFRKSTPRDLANMFISENEDDGVRIVDFADYDYSGINELLSHNTMQSLCGGEAREIGNILVTGAGGFMGIHVLAHFLQYEKGSAFCLLRKGRHDSAMARLKMLFIYYFGDALEAEFDSRVTAFHGDVTDYGSFEKLEDLPVQTVFNCAANVKHFSSGTDIEDVNMGGAQNCVKFCEKTGARLIHFSTISVAGASVDNTPPAGAVLDERTLYIGQRLDTKYTNSKLLSERIVLEAAAERGLDGKVIRVGTLSARESDGEFQMNFLTNNFMGRLRSFEILGCFPYSMINSPICMGPIDESAKAFFALAKTPKACCLFNCTNNHTIPLGDIIGEMIKSGIQIDFVDDDVFAAALSEAEKDPQKAAILSSMIAYKNMAHGKQLLPIRPVNDYTTQALAKMGFFWKHSGEEYLLKVISAMSSLGFFDSTNLAR